MDFTQQHIADSPLTAVRRLAPEDVRVGDDVALYEITYQVASFLWCGTDPVTIPFDRPVSLTYRAPQDLDPLRVKSVCLPFVLCKSSDRTHRTYDLRQVQLVRLDADFALCVRQSRRRDASKTSKRKKKR